MQIRWEHVRNAANWVWAPIVEPLLILPADESGLLEHFGEGEASMIAWLDALTASPWFHWIGGGLIGFSIGAYGGFRVRSMPADFCVDQIADGPGVLMGGLRRRWPELAS
jgi:hypothetical protein